MRHSKIVFYVWSCLLPAAVPQPCLSSPSMSWGIVFRNSFGCQVITEDLPSHHRSEWQLLRIVEAQEASELGTFRLNSTRTFVSETHLNTFQTFPSKRCQSSARIIGRRKKNTLPPSIFMHPCAIFPRVRIFRPTYRPFSFCCVFKFSATRRTLTLKGSTFNVQMSVGVTRNRVFIVQASRSVPFHKR